MSKNNSILVVDDNEINRKVASLFLQRMGWEADQAADALEAMKQLEQKNYSCVLLDISMPGMTGMELCAKLRTDPRWEKLYLVAYTAHTMHDEKNAILDAGFNTIVTKPISKESLVAALPALPPQTTNL